MRIALALFVLALAATPAVAEETSMVWLTDLEQAKKEAARRNVPILLQFSGSDWCGWCIKLDGEVFSKEAFATYAKDNLVLVKADFPRRTKQDKALAEQNEKLAATYEVAGFPTVLLLDAKGKILAKTGYQRGGAQAYVEHLSTVLKDAERAASQAPAK